MGLAKGETGTLGAWWGGGFGLANIPLAGRGGGVLRLASMALAIIGARGGGVNCDFDEWVTWALHPGLDTFGVLVYTYVEHL